MPYSDKNKEKAYRLTTNGKTMHNFNWVTVSERIVAGFISGILSGIVVAVILMHLLKH